MKIYANVVESNARIGNKRLIFLAPKTPAELNFGNFFIALGQSLVNSLHEIARFVSHFS